MKLATQRLAAWSLLFACAAQFIHLWPLPQEVAADRVAFWTKIKAQWEAVNPSTSENPEWTTRTKAQSLSEANEALSDPDKLLDGARIGWTLSLVTALTAGAAAILGLRGSNSWRWMSLVSLGSYMGLHQPWILFRVFLSEGQVNLGRGISTLTFIAREPDVFAWMVLLNAVVPLLLLTVGIYAAIQMKRQPRR